MTRKPNKLINEKSPYLLQHAYNPVDWHPWGEEAFREARATGKPLFLSVGYSTCHWCHVMEHESFENDAIAALMNQHFINIKVDREERPDVDALYMTAVQGMTGAGGWPMSVWLTHDLKPFYAGTYFPPDDRYGRPGFPSVIEQLADVWKKDREKVETSAGQIMDFLKETLERPARPGDIPDARASLDQLAAALQVQHDSVNGGFGRAPKFPMPVYMEGLLAHYDLTGDRSSLETVLFTLKKMAAGGIYDQLGGGFARYSTDERWVVPHFEKMLYDNAQLIRMAVEAHRRSEDPLLERIVHQSIAYALRDLQHADGGFYSAEDADSEGKEGTFYLWTLHEVRTHLEPAEADVFIAHYGITLNGNFMDPHTQEAGKNVLTQARATEDSTREILERAEKKLLHVRNARPRPHRDEKIITEWNGLMISALSRAADWFAHEGYRQAAERAAHFIQTHLYDSARGELYRRWRDGERKIPAQQTDYAFLIQGLLDLFEATGAAEWLAWAISLQERHESLFRDPAGGYFMTVPAPDLLVRMKDDGDNVIPSGNSIAARNALRLAAWTGRPDFEAAGLAVLRVFGNILKDQPARLASMSATLPLVGRPPAHVVILGLASHADTRALSRTARQANIPGLSVLPVTPGPGQEKLGMILPFISQLKTQNGDATAYFCREFTCQRPTSDPVELNRQLRAQT